MEQTTQLKQTVEKLDRALTRLQDIQSALRGHSPLPLTTNHTPDKVSQLSILHELGVNHLIQSGNRRRWSMPAPLMHDALSDAVATSKFAKKTVDMVKVQKKKQAAKSANTSSSSSSQAEHTSLLRASNRINLPQRVDDMSTPHHALGRKPRDSSKENKRTPHQSKLELKEGGLGSAMHAEKHQSGKSRDEASLPLHTDKRAHSTRIAPEEEDGRPNIFKLRDLKHLQEATPDPFASQDDRQDGTDCDRQDHHATAKRSSLSMRTLMRMEDEERKHSRPSLPTDDEAVNSFSSAMASKSFSVQLEEIKSSKKKSWNFTHQGKISDNVVVMFPNLTFDETTPPTTTPPEYHQKTMDATITKRSSLHEKAPTLPSTTETKKAPSSDKQGSLQKKEKIVRLAPCTTRSSSARKPKLQPPSAIASASTSKGATSAKKQKWLCTLTHPPSPTLIRRLPEAHEMREVKQTTQNWVDGEDTHCVANNLTDDARDSLGRSWSFGNPSLAGSSRTSSEARRSSWNPPAGGQAFSFLSKHFHAWKVASKQDK